MQNIGIQLADVGIRMYLADREFIVCPTMVRVADSTSFDIIKVAEKEAKDRKAAGM